jgi:hypothetical protein
MIEAQIQKYRIFHVLILHITFLSDLLEYLENLLNRPMCNCGIIMSKAIGIRQ